MNKLTVIGILLPLSVFGQTTEQNVLSSSGNHFSNGSVQVSYTIGEPVIETVSNPSNTLTQGFHQTSWNFLGVEDLNSDLILTVFPNPVGDALTVKTEQYNNLSYQLFDENGKLIFEGNLLNSETLLYTSNLQPAAYSLRILNNQLEMVKLFKLLKSQ